MTGLTSILFTYFMYLDVIPERPCSYKWTGTEVLLAAVLLSVFNHIWIICKLFLIIYLLTKLIYSSILLKAKNGYATQSLEFIHLNFSEIYQMMIIVVGLCCVTNKDSEAYIPKSSYFSPWQVHSSVGTTQV